MLKLVQAIFTKKLYIPMDCFLIICQTKKLLEFKVLWYRSFIWGAAIFTTSENTAAVFLAKSVKKWVCFCQLQFEVYNWQYLFSTGKITPDTLSYSQIIVIFTPMNFYMTVKFTVSWQKYYTLFFFNINYTYWLYTNTD